MNRSAILRRWDRIAHAQLCEAAARLAAENDELQDRVIHAEWSADSWREDFLKMCEQTGAQPGLTQDGRFVAVTGVQP